MRLYRVSTPDSTRYYSNKKVIDKTGEPESIDVVDAETECNSLSAELDRALYQIEVLRAEVSALTLEIKLP